VRERPNQIDKGIDIIENALVVTINELVTQEIPDSVWSNLNTTQLIIQKERPKKQWSTRPPLSWYEHLDFAPPYWVLNDKIGQLTELKSLILFEMDIQILPDSIVELQKLEVLNLSFNKLEISNELDKLKQLRNLKHLILYGNHYVESEMQVYKNMFPDLIIEYKDENN